MTPTPAGLTEPEGVGLGCLGEGLGRIWGNQSLYSKLTSLPRLGIEPPVEVGRQGVES